MPHTNYAVFLLFFCLCAFSAQTAQANNSPKPAQPTQGWQIDQCQARSAFDNGLSLDIGLSQTGSWVLDITVPKAGFGTAESYPLTLLIDKSFSQKGTAQAISDQQLRFTMPPTQLNNFSQALANGAVLVLQGAEDSTLFALKGSSTVAQKLLLCANPAEKKPAAPTPAATAAPTAAKAVPIPAALLQLLQDSGLDRVTPLAPQKETASAFSVQWQLNNANGQKDVNIWGGIREERVDEQEQFPDLVASFVQALLSSCTGAASQTLSVAEKIKGLTLQTGGLRCQQPDGRLSELSVIFYLTPARIFSLIVHAPLGESTDAALNAARAARDAVATTIKNAAPP